MTNSPPLEEKKPWYKNLFLWYFIIGAVTLTLIRPLLRREPRRPRSRAGWLPSNSSIKMVSHLPSMT